MIPLLRFLWMLPAFGLVPVTLVSAPAEEAIPLFDGISLAGWQATENPATWRVEDGALVCRGERSHLFYVGAVAGADFRNFELVAEVMTTPGSNSGIYFHTEVQEEGWPATGYEAQILNSSLAPPGKYSERKMTGSIYALRNTWVAPVADGEWFEYRIRVEGRTIRTFVNGVLTCAYTEPEDAWRPEGKKGRRLGSGTFALQGHDPESVVRFRSVRVRLLPEEAATPGEALADPSLERLIVGLSNDNFALLDFGLVASTPLVQEAQLAAARRYGVTLGYELGDSRPALGELGRTGAVLVVNDRDQPPDPAMLRAAAAAGAKLLFTSGGVNRLDPARLEARWRAIRAAELEWDDLWAPEDLQMGGGQ